MGDIDIMALNRVLKWIGLEMTSREEVRVLPDPVQAPYLSRPQTLVGVSSDPNAAGSYSLRQVPQLERIVRSFAPLGTSVWRENPLPNTAEKRAILDTLRAQMQVIGDDRTATSGRILATTLYWNAVKSLRLTQIEARHEASSLRAIIAARRNAADRPSQEIVQNADLALGVLLEVQPNAK